jgi:Methionyl-tRNA formyltransferase
LREGESETGVTFHYLTPKIDAGNILYQSALPIFDYDNYNSLARRIGAKFYCLNNVRVGEVLEA